MKITVPFPILAPLLIVAGFGCGWAIWIEVVLK